MPAAAITTMATDQAVDGCNECPRFCWPFGGVLGEIPSAGSCARKSWSTFGVVHATASRAAIHSGDAMNIVLLNGSSNTGMCPFRRRRQLPPFLRVIHHRCEEKRWQASLVDGAEVEWLQSISVRSLASSISAFSGVNRKPKSFG